MAPQDSGALHPGRRGQLAREVIFRTGRIPPESWQVLERVEDLLKFVRLEIDLAKDLPDERAGKVSASVVRHRRRPSIRVAIEDVAALLPCALKSD